MRLISCRAAGPANDKQEQHVSLKENLTMVKEELNTEEQFFEQAVKTERFIKKYKKQLIALAAAVALGIVSLLAYDAYRAQKTHKINAAFLLLQQSPGNEEAARTLQSDAPLLYDAWRMGQAVKNGDVDALKALETSAATEVADVSAYEAAARQKDAAALGHYTYNADAVYKDLALVDEAVLLMHEGKIDEAHRRLKMIDAQSPVSALASALMHYGVK